ncbi:HD-GYP domain-containing protein [Desulforhopalus sp. 52FAK]
MICKVPISLLRVGVFVHDFNCSHNSQSFFINQTHIKSEKVIEILKSWDIKEVYIDTSRGLSPKKPPKEEVIGPDEITNIAAPLVPLKEEIKIAQKIRQQAADVIQQSMASIHKAKIIDINSAYNVIEKMHESVKRNKDALHLLTRIRNKDEYTLMHSISVSSMLLAFCNASRIDYDSSIKMAVGALLHDIGKTQIPLTILNKPGRLNDNEFNIIKTHTEHSADILSKTKELPDEAFDIALHHHERCDGSGYPYGLRKESITTSSKLASICDVYDAITAERCYKKAIDKVTGLTKIYDMRNGHFDKKMTLKFIKFIGVYPIGAYVRLENGITGVVIDSTHHILQPIVRLFYDNNKKTLIKLRDVDLSQLNMDVFSYDMPENWEPSKKQAFAKTSKALLKI